ncbi:ComEA family DNA-binding protein [Brevibacillus ginsengisoli]|uniref:ComEA family DNA-binding protein n=1 Tax=Brevibacillus ginsengisoli TaxID=363854 RepID=UPI003CF9C474
MKNQRWRIWGVIYLLVFIVALYPPSKNIGAVIALTLWIGSIIHAIKIRPAYLVQLDVLKENEKALDNQKISKLRQEAEAKFNVTENKKSQPPQPKMTNASQEEEAIGIIDLNTASESEIASIPAIGIILAKKVSIKRQELGGFQSFEHFSQIMELEKQTIEKIEHRVVFSQVENNNTQNKSGGRVIDF